MDPDNLPGGYDAPFAAGDSPCERVDAESRVCVQDQDLVSCADSMEVPL